MPEESRVPASREPERSVAPTPPPPSKTSGVVGATRFLVAIAIASTLVLFAALLVAGAWRTVTTIIDVVGNLRLRWPARRWCLATGCRRHGSAAPAGRAGPGRRAPVGGHWQRHRLGHTARLKPVQQQHPSRVRRPLQQPNHPGPARNSPPPRNS
jgi:hypothetical protein